MEASGAGHVECVKELLDRGAETNLQNKVSLCVWTDAVECLVDC